MHKIMQRQVMEVQVTFESNFRMGKKSVLSDFDHNMFVDARGAGLRSCSSPWIFTHSNLWSFTQNGEKVTKKIQQVAVRQVEMPC